MTVFREVTVNKFLLGTIATVMSITTSLIIAPPTHALDCASGGPCAIGDIGPGGGIVFLAPSSAGNTTGKFFEAAANTWNGSAPDGTAKWCADSIANIPGLGTAIGTGVTNSATIDTTCVSTGINNAAEYVRSKTIGGLTDWFLPSIDEMLALYNQSTLLTGVYATNQADVDAARYLTSSQGTNVANAGGVYMQGSGFPGTSSEFAKDAAFAIRPMRMFTATERSVVVGGGPEPVLQQFGKTAAATCLETAPESLNWAGVSSDGWGESWAQWVNGGNGGAVCTRTLIYNTAQSKWVTG